MYGTFWALLPPIIAIVLALITKEAYSSLFIGVLIGAMFCAGFSPVGTLDTALNAASSPPSRETRASSSSSSCSA